MERSKPSPLSIDPTYRRHRALSGTSSIRPSSSASLRPPSSASSRPSSSASIRPPSSTSTRPSSSASTNRPTSSASFRPLSQTSHRPPSRFSILSARQTSRLQSFAQNLVKQVGKISPGDEEEDFQAAVDLVVKTLDYTSKTGPTIDMDTMNKRIRGHTRKARIQSRDAWAEALDMAYARLKSQMEETKDLDQEITLVRLPDHLQLLILLSLPPNDFVSQYARDYLENARNPRPRRDGPTWKEILDEEPFEGQHWEGVYGLPPGSTVEGWESKSLESTPPLSPLTYGDFNDARRPVSPLSWSSPGTDDTDVPPFPQKDPKEQLHPSVSYNHRQDVETLQTQQYWRKEWRTDASLSGDFIVGDACTLGPSMSHVLGGVGIRVLESPRRAKYIHEHHAVREILMGLHGHKNLMMKWSHENGSNFFFELMPDAPRVVHLTLTSQRSILETFARFATTVEHLRKFVSRVFDFAIRPAQISKELPPLTGYNRRITRTVEAFSEAVDLHIQSFTKWCSSKEEEICKATLGLDKPVTVSFLNLEMSLRDQFSKSFDVLLDVIRCVMRKTSRFQDRDAEVWMLAELPAYSPPSAISSLLLDSLLESAQDYLAMGDNVTHKVLMRVFIMTAEPMWTMVGHWLHDGMPIQEAVDRRATRSYAGLIDEFFVEDNQLFLLDPDYWIEGFVLRDRSSEGERAPDPIPKFLQLIACHVLSAGKAVGLLRALGLPLEVENEDRQLHTQWLSFTCLFKGTNLVDSTRISSVDDLSRFVYDELIPQCRVAQRRLAQVIVDECELWYHLSAMEDLYLMRRGDITSRLSDTIFAKMDAQQAWSDYHFLNSTLRDIIQTTARKGINPVLVQLSYRGGRDAAARPSVHAMDDLFMEYAAPFPLTYIFGPSSLNTYSSIFVFLLKTRRAKSALERILVRGGAADAPHMREEMKVFYAMRSKLSWFVNSLLDFVATYVLHSQVLKFHDSLRQAKSLDEIIHLHDDHLSKLANLCLLQENTSALRRTVHSILDMSLRFADAFVAFAGDTTHDISRTPITPRRHRSRRLKQQRRNTIGFSLPPEDAAQSSDSDSDVDDENPLRSEAPQTSFSMTVSMSLADEDLYGHVDQMSRDLDGLVRFFRRGVENLVASTSGAAPAFGIFAFTLEDWDR